jgi:hypothetical protein
MYFKNVLKREEDIMEISHLLSIFSEVNGHDIWLRKNLLKTGGPEAIASAIMHEAAHLAGAPGELLAEIAIERLHQASGYPR